MANIEYSNYTIPKLASLAKNNVDTHSVLFQKLADSQESFGRYAALSPKNVLEILGNISPEVAPLAAQGIGVSYLKSQKEPLYKALKILLQNNVQGTIERVVTVAKEKLKKDYNFELLKTAIELDPEIGLNKLHSFNVTLAHKSSAVKALALKAARTGKIQLVAFVRTLASRHLIKTENKALVDLLIEIDPAFTLSFIDTLKMDTADKTRVTEQLKEMIPEAFESTQSGQFYEKIKRTKSRIDIDPPLFGSVKHEEIGLKTLIKAHAQRRAVLFFYLLLAFYKSNISLALNKTLFRYGKGEVREGGDYHGCHSSIITSLKMKQSEDALAWDVASFFDLYLAHSCNATYFLPANLNQVDCKIEGLNTNGAKKLRKRAIEILQQVSAGDLDPEEGMEQFILNLEEVTSEVEEEGNLTPEQRKFLKYQQKGIRQILDSNGNILGDFFRFNLALTIPESPKVHGYLKQKKWSDTSPKAKEILFLKAQKVIQSQKVLVVNDKAVQ